MDSETLLQRYRSGKRDFTWADLAGVNLAGANLPNIDFSRANLAGANLSGANLTGANLTKANLHSTNLTEAQLTGSSLRRADLSEAQIQPKQLAQAAIAGAVLPAPIVAAQAAAAAHAAELRTQAASQAEAVPGIAPDRQPAPPPAALNPGLVADLPTLAAALESRELNISLGIAAVGYLLYGVVLGNQQVPLVGLGLVWPAAGAGLLAEEWVWFVPPLGLLGVVLGMGVSLGVIIFFVPVMFSISMGLVVYGSIVSWSWAKTLQSTAWFGSLVFLVMHSAIWLFDGGSAYSGGGIVLKLDSLPVTVLLGLGLLAVGRGALAYGQLNDMRYSLGERFLAMGGSAAAGLLLGWLVGR